MLGVKQWNPMFPNIFKFGETIGTESQILFLIKDQFKVHASLDTLGALSVLQSLIKRAKRVSIIVVGYSSASAGSGFGYYSCNL